MTILNGRKDIMDKIQRRNDMNVRNGKLVKSGNLSMKERQAYKDFERQQEDWYSKPGTERAQIHHDDNVYTKLINFQDALDEYHMANLPDGMEAEYIEYDLTWNEDSEVLLLSLRDFCNAFGSVTSDGGTDDIDDTWRLMFTLFANMLNKKKWNGENLVTDQQGDEIWIDKPVVNIETWSFDELMSYADFLHNSIAELAPKVWEQLAHKKSLMNSKKPTSKLIKSGLMTPSLTGYAQGTYKDVKQMLDAIDGGMDYSNGNAMNFLFGLDNKSFDEVLLPYSFIIFTFRHTDGTPWTDDELDSILDENNGMLP